MGSKDVAGLVSRARSGDMQAQGLLYARLEERLLPRLRRAYGGEARDVLHDVYLKLCDLGFDVPTEGFDAYTAAMARNRAKKLRKRARRCRPSWLSPSEAAKPAIDRCAKDVSDRDACRALTSVLDEKDAEVIDCIKKGFSAAEGASALGISCAAYRQRKRRVLKKVRRELRSRPPIHP